MGILYLTCVDGWQVYARPFQEAKEWYDGYRQGDALLPDGSAVEGNGTGSGNGAGQDGAAVSGSGNAVGEEAGDSPGTDSASEAEGESGAPGTVSGSGNGVLSPESGQAGAPSSDIPSEGSAPEGEGGDGQPGMPAEGGEMPPEASEPAEPTYMTVEDDYFADAVFIGDSRTVGLFDYAGLEETAAFYASKGLTVYRMFDSEIVAVPGESRKITVEEALQQNTFAKIYLMIGINEMGTGTVESFLEAYQEAVAHLQELQPDAIIYLQAIIKVTTKRSDQGDYINNEGIIARNEGIAQMADNEKIFYLDVNPSICDETGGMIPEYTFDGVHLKAKYIDIWKDFLKTHAVSLP